MNPYGSYRGLLNGSKQALFAAVEIYNKPKFDYREEVLVILLVNAWELFLLAILSKNRQRIFRKKERGQDYKTWDFDNAFAKAELSAYRKENEVQAIRKNLKLIRKYRNNVIHYYSDSSTQYAIHALSQSAIRNYVALFKEIFKRDVAKEANIVLLPLGFNEQPDFVEFFKGNGINEHNPFVKELFVNLQNLEKEGTDSFFVTRCLVKLERARNKQAPDLSSTHSPGSNPVVFKNVNPDYSHPFFQKDILKRLNGGINNYSFQAILSTHKLKNDEKYCWASTKGGSPRYSDAVVEFVNNLGKSDISKARKEYSKKLKELRELKAKKTGSGSRRTSRRSR